MYASLNCFRFLLFFYLLLSCETKQKSFPNKFIFSFSQKDSLLVLPKNGKIYVDSIFYDISKIDKYKRIIQRYAKLNDLDWLLIVAIILKESNFNQNAVSNVGAKGLMQIMPQTENELSENLEFNYISERPKENLKAGIFHLRKQWEKFDFIQSKKVRIKCALAAYNSGAGRVYDAIKLAKFKYGDTKWDHIVWGFKHLKRENYLLHLDVWPLGKPYYGYFYHTNETLSYVRRIFKIYGELEKYY